MSSYTLWRGSTISFSMAAGADHNAEANQDRITDNVWITRAGVGQLLMFDLKMSPTATLVLQEQLGHKGHLTTLLI